MACKKCGSDWVTATGRDCKTCPHCCKQQRFRARREGRLPSEVTKNCCVCNAEFTVNPQRQSAKTCGSDACDKQLKRDKANRYRAKKKAGLTLKRQPARPLPVCKREGCTADVKAHKHEYCSPACAGADAREFKRPVKGRSIKERKEALISAVFEWLMVKWMKCECCGKQIIKQTSMQRVCSDACRYRLEKPLHEECLDCGSPLKADTRYVRRCKACRKKRVRWLRKQAGKTPKKRCKRHGVPCDASVKSKKVFERDDYICQLCRRKCLAKFTVIDGMPHPLSPTVDHIIAIALGIKGHTWDNVQCACWECNVAKGASALGQLRLALSEV
jgi:hypothetical protein